MQDQTQFTQLREDYKSTMDKLIPLLDEIRTKGNRTPAPTFLAAFNAANRFQRILKDMDELTGNNYSEEFYKYY